MVVYGFFVCGYYIVFFFITSYYVIYYLYYYPYNFIPCIITIIIYDDDE